MKKKLLIIASLIILGFYFYSCKKDQTTTVPQQNMNYQYFPMKKGDSIIYKVDSFHTYSNAINGAIDTTHYYVLEYVEDTFTDDQGRLAYRLNRMYRTNLLAGWTQMGVWWEQIANNTAQRVEENIRFVKLTFPPANGKAWNGNIYNTIDSENYYNYHDSLTFKPWTGDYKSYDSTVTVLQINHYDPFIRIYGYEVYAANVGLVYKQFRYANYFGRDSIPFTNDTINVLGFGVRQTIYYCSYHK